MNYLWMWKCFTWLCLISWLIDLCFVPESMASLAYWVLAIVCAERAGWLPKAGP